MNKSHNVSCPIQLISIKSIISLYCFSYRKQITIYNIMNLYYVAIHIHNAQKINKQPALPINNIKISLNLDG